MSSREDRGRYRGRRRAPSAPRARYAAVATTAFVGASVVALGTSALMPNMQSGPSTLAGSSTSLSGSLSAGLADRQSGTDRASRSDVRDATSASDTIAADLWQLPLKSYTVASPFGQHWGTMNPGVDLATNEGTPYYATHSGVVKLARYNGGLGYCVVIDAGNGITLVYGHASRLLVQEGQRVQAGDVLGLVGDTGYAFGDHLHFEVRQNGTAIDPVQFMLAHGVDINNQTAAAS